MAARNEETNPMQSSTTSSTASEVVYGSGSPIGSDENRVMSERVQTLASSIYREFEMAIKKYGEDSVKSIMPLAVHILECLDEAYLEKEELVVDMEMLKEENEQLMTQYEREKQLRRSQDQKYMELEDGFIGQNRELEQKIESLESIMRMLELKAKNASDHAARLEEREADQKSEFDRLHERYNVLLRTHIDHMERTKYLMGADKFELMQNMPLPNAQVRSKMGMASSVDASSIRGVSDLISAHMSQSTSINLANHISNETDWQEEFGQTSDVELTPRDPAEKSESETPEKEEVGAGKDENRPTEEVEEPTSATAVNERLESEDSLGPDLTVNDTFIGMGKEVENLIKENTELLETKNALNIVKNDLIARVDELSSEQDILREEVSSLELVKKKMAEQINGLEDELKVAKKKLAEAELANDEEDVPMAQRKRFTRSEMQRVLIDRNTYKEKLMELEESLKWTELQRAKKAASANAAPKKSGGIWDFFSGLFGDTPQQQPRRRTGGGRSSDPLQRKRTAMTKSVDFLDPDAISERRVAERREQYKQVKEHVTRDESGRLQAYGWSLPPAVDQSNTMVPVPVCCRPLLDQMPTLKVWCATGVILRGGRRADGSFVVGEPVYYSQRAKRVPKDSQAPDVIDAELARARAMEACERELGEWESSSLIWVGSSNQGRSHVALLDANNPNNVIDTFSVCDAHLLCLSSVPGVLEADAHQTEASARALLRGSVVLGKTAPDVTDTEGFGAVEWAELRKMEDSEDGVPTYCTNELKPSPKRSRDFSVCEQVASTSEPKTVIAVGKQPPAVVEEGEEADEKPTKPPKADVPLVRGECIPLEKKEEEEQKKKEEERPTMRGGRAALPPHIRDALSKYEGIVVSTALPTIWLGAQNQYIQVHSSVSDWRTPLRRVKLPDAVLSILHFKGRVFAALANGCIAVFHRNKLGEWSDEGFHTIRVGKATNSVRALTVVGTSVWAAYKNCVIVIDADSLEVQTVFAAHPKKDSQIRTMQCVGAGVWLSVRLDSTLRLYHAHTYEHLQDIDIHPYVTKMLGTSRLDFAHTRTTALLVSNRRLWIGTGTGVIISIPFSDSKEQKVEGVTKTAGLKGGPGGLVRVYAEKKSECGGGFIPYCNMTQAQLSFHGHKDSVKFFLAVPGTQEGDNQAESHLRKMLILSGGDGYIDFRMGEEEEKTDSKEIRPRDMSHLIIWELDAEIPIIESETIKK